MELTQFYIWISLIVCFVLMKISEVNGKPTFDLYYEPVESVERGREYVLNNGQRLTPELSRLRRGYYYIDDGYITAVSDDVYPETFTADRRQDSTLQNRKDVRFSPVVRYKQTRTKRKKLFVPNLFG